MRDRGRGGGGGGKRRKEGGRKMQERNAGGSMLLNLLHQTLGAEMQVYFTRRGASCRRLATNVLCFSPIPSPSHSCPQPLTLFLFCLVLSCVLSVRVSRDRSRGVRSVCSRNPARSGTSWRRSTAEDFLLSTARLVWVSASVQACVGCVIDRTGAWFLGRHSQNPCVA